MPKLAVVAVLAALAFVAQGFPTRQDDIAAAAAAGNWDLVHRLLNQKFGVTSLGHFDRHTGGDVRSLKPEKGGHVYGESEFTYHSAATDEKGQIQQQSGGHKIINKDGKILEFDFKPQN